MDTGYLAREIALRLPPEVNITLANEMGMDDPNDTVVEIIAENDEYEGIEIEIVIQKEQAAPMSRILSVPNIDESMLLVAQVAAELLLSNPNYLLVRPDPLPEPSYPPELDLPPEPPPEEEPTPKKKRWSGWFDSMGWGGYTGSEGYAHGTLAGAIGALSPSGLLLAVQAEYDFPVEFNLSGQRFELHSIPIMARIGWQFTLSKPVRFIPFVALGDRMHLVVFRPETGKSSQSVDHSIAGEVGLNLRIFFHKNGYVQFGSRVELLGEQRHLLNNQEAFTTGTWRVDGGLGLGILLP